VSGASGAESGVRKKDGEKGETCGDEGSFFISGFAFEEGSREAVSGVPSLGSCDVQ
jgi:hypothetical protein